MDKFLAITSDVREGLAASGLEIYPEDYKGDILNELRFARYTILLPTAEAYDYSRTPFVEGMLMVRLFSEAGYGGDNCYNDAAALNASLENEQMTNKTTFEQASLSSVQADPENETLVMVIYSIPFKYHA